MTISSTDPRSHLATAQSHLQRAYDLEATDQLPAALAACRSALSLDPTLAEAHNLSGILLEALERPSAAIRAYARALQLDPTFSDAAKNLQDLKLEQRTQDPLVTVARFQHVLQAHVARTKLEAAGIGAFVADENIVTVNWLWVNLVGWVRLQVRQSDATRARRVLARQPYDPRRRKSNPRCPQCRSFDVYYARYAMRWVYLTFLILRMPLPIPKRKWICRNCGYEWKETQSE